MALGWPGNDRRFKQATGDFQLSPEDQLKWQLLFSSPPLPAPPSPPPTPSPPLPPPPHVLEQRRVEAEARRLEAEAKGAESWARCEEARQQEKLEREQREAPLLRRLMAGRPPITKSNAGEWPPPYPFARRCQGESCACKQYCYNPTIAHIHPKRVKCKDAFSCRSTRKDAFVCESPCSGEYLHLTLSEPMATNEHMDGRIVRKPMVSETSELMRWHAQLTGGLWPPNCMTFAGTRTTASDGSLLFFVNNMDLKVHFEKAFQQWKRLNPVRPKTDPAPTTDHESQGEESESDYGEEY